MTDLLPRWDVTDVYESLTARSFTDAFELIGAEQVRLAALFDEHDIRGRPPSPATDSDATVAAQLIDALNHHQQRLQELGSYTHSFVSTDSFDDTAQGIASRLEVVGAATRPLLSRFAEWLSATDVAALAALHPTVGAHRGPLQRLARRAEHQMSEHEESLYAALLSSGSSGWTRLHADITSQLTAPVELPGAAATVMPMAAVRGLATHGEEGVRRAAYEAEMAAWPTVEVACTAAMNGVKGEAQVVNARRGWNEPLDAALFANSVSRPTFDAMHHAVVESLPHFRRWMRAKARLHGHDSGLPWWDLVAPAPTDAPKVSWDTSLGLVRDAFAAYGGQLAGMVDRAVDERWIDASPRVGKRGGAFCMSFVGDRSLVFLNFTESAASTQTTAHELGHAYHNVQLAERTPMQRQLPMALAETASIFCETLLTDHALSTAGADAELALLDVDLAGANQVVVDIHSRFLFEREVFVRRQRGRLASAELNEMMLDAQQQAYGDGLDQRTAHRYMWAVKPHYYSSHFYNWPYTYGLLFGLGLFARYQHDRAAFHAVYDDVLSRAGMDDAETLGAAFGFDVTDTSFWRSSLDVLRGRIDRYESLVAQHGAGG
jgi:pepF/M3 family oligoendopeptidase